MFRLAMERSLKSANMSSKKDNKHWGEEFFLRNLEHPLTFLESFLNSLDVPGSLLSYRDKHHQHSLVWRRTLESDPHTKGPVKLTWGLKEFIFTWIHKLMLPQLQKVAGKCWSKSQAVCTAALVLQVGTVVHTPALKHGSTIPSPSCRNDLAIIVVCFT